MKAIVKQGKELLFLEGASASNLEDVKDELIINLNDKWILDDYSFAKGKLIINTTKGEIVIAFSSPVVRIALSQYEKDQVVFKLIKDGNV